MVLRRCVAWISYLNISMLIGTLSIALFNASKDEIAKNMAYAYAAISVGIMVRLSLSSAPPLFTSAHPTRSSVCSDLWICSLPTPYHHDSSTRPRSLWCVLPLLSSGANVRIDENFLHFLLFRLACAPIDPCGPLRHTGIHERAPP